MNHRLVPMLDNHPLIVNQYHNLCAKILRTCSYSEKRCLLITSSVPTEGKSLTAINLAITLARIIKEDVVLIDGDLRNPNLHNLLNYQPKYTLLDYFQHPSEFSNGDAAALENIVCPSEVPNLLIIPGKENAVDLAEILASPQMLELMNELKRRYKNKFIIIDSPPIVPFSDSIILSSYADYIIFLIQAGGPPREIVLEAVNSLEQDKILGVILNNVDSASSEYTYNYSFYSSRYYKNNLPHKS